MRKDIKLLFIHGAGGTSSKWRKLKEELDRSGVLYSIINLPGHGKDKRVVPASVEEYAGIINEEIREDTIIIGHSMGGLIGIEVAARNNNVKGLVFVSSHYELPVHPKVLEKLLSELIFPESFFRASYGKEVSQELLEEERKELTYNPHATILKDFNCCANYKSGRKQISQLTIPLLAVYGTEDQLIPKNADEELVKVSQNIIIMKAEKSGHYVNLENSKVLMESILTFYKTIE